MLVGDVCARARSTSIVRAMAAMESLRLALTPFPALVASAPPSRIDRQLREVAAALAALLSPQETDEMLPEQQAAQEDAVHLLLDTFCRAHVEDHMSDHTKLGSWRLPYVAMLHSHTSLHLPLIKQLELLLHSGAALSPAQCSALCTFMLFMNPYQILPRDQVPEDQAGHFDGPLKDGAFDMQSDKKNVDERSQCRENQIENCHVRVLFEWRWDACFRAQSSEVLYKDGHVNSQVQGEVLELESAKGQMRGLRNHWMEQFCDVFLMDSETNILWATRFAASYLRNMAVYWEHILFNKGCRETWLLTDLARQLKNITLVGPIFVAFVPQNMVLFLIWLQQRLDFASHFGELAEFASLKKSFVLCETVLASPLGVLLQSTKVSLPLPKFFELELRTGWKEWLLSKSCHLFLRYVVWGGDSPGGPDGCSFGLLWKEYGGDRARACIALTVVFLCKQEIESRQLLGAQSNHELPKNSWSGTKKQCVRADPDVLQTLPQMLWLKKSEASPAEVFILQIIVELSSNLDLQCGPWFLEAAFDCLGNQARLENAVLMHSETCAYAHMCKSRHYNSGVCSARRLKSCIAALPPSHSISYERLYKVDKVFMFCWLGDGPFSIDFAFQLLSYFQVTQTSGTFLKTENQWNTLLLATWVRFFDVIGAPILSLHHMVDGLDLGSILAHLHTSQQALTSSTKDVRPDIHRFGVAAKAMPQLAAFTLLESLFTSSFTSSSLREGFLAKLATEASPHQHEVSARVLDILRRIITEERPGSQMEDPHKTVPEDDAVFLKFLIVNLVDVLSMAAISSPDLILQKWTAFEYKRKWLSTSKASTLLSLASIELELDERIGKPRRSVWDILLEWVVTLITLCPDSIISYLRGEVLVESSGVGPKAFALILAFSALPKETVLYLQQSVSTSWSLLLSRMRIGLENGFRLLFLGDRKSMSSSIKAEIEAYLLQLQGIVQKTL